MIAEFDLHWQANCRALDEMRGPRQRHANRVSPDNWEATLPRRERRSTQRLFEGLRGRGYDGAHDSVHRFTKSWRDEKDRTPTHAFVPLSFAPGEAYQFDWSHETITLQGLPLTIKAAHMKLSYSRMPFVCAYFRETQELVFDAHDKAFEFYGGICRRGIYDSEP